MDKPVVGTMIILVAVIMWFRFDCIELKEENIKLKTTVEILKNNEEARVRDTEIINFLMMDKYGTKQK